MNRILGMNKAQRLALHAMMVLAGRPDRRTNSGTLKAALQASRWHLYKIMERLEAAGLIEGVSGPLGGFVLARPSGEISLLEIFAAAGVNFSGHSCLMKKRCGRKACGLARLAATMNNELRSYLAATRLSEFKDRYRSYADESPIKKIRPRK